MESVNNLCVFFPTEIFSPIVDLRGQSSVHEGDDVILQCNVKSNPPSQLVWYKDGTEIKVPDRNFFRVAEQCRKAKNGYYFNIKNGQKTFSHLVICDSKLERNNGTYMCMARNQLGSGKSLLTLNVLGRYQYFLVLNTYYLINLLYFS